MFLDLQSPYTFLILASGLLAVTATFVLLANLIGTLVSFGLAIGSLVYSRRLMNRGL